MPYYADQANHRAELEESIEKGIKSMENRISSVEPAAKVSKCWHCQEAAGEQFPVCKWSWCEQLNNCL